MSFICTASILQSDPVIEDINRIEIPNLERPSNEIDTTPSNIRPQIIEHRCYNFDKNRIPIILSPSNEKWKDVVLSGDDALSISNDGCKLAFSARATDISSNAQLEHVQIFVYNMSTAKLILASKNTFTKDPGNFNSKNPSISSDGNFVAFSSGAVNLFDPTAQIPERPADIVSQVYLFNISNDSLHPVSNNSEGEFGNKNSINPSLSADGRLVVFQSFATNLRSTIGLLPNSSDIYLRNMSQSAPIMVTDARTGSGRDKMGPISRNAVIIRGDIIAWESDHNRLVSGDGNGKFDIFARTYRRRTHTLDPTFRISQKSDGSDLSWASSRPRLTSNSTYLSYRTKSDQLVGPSNEFLNGRIRNVLFEFKRGIHHLINYNDNNRNSVEIVSSHAEISGDGRFAVYRVGAGGEQWRLKVKDWANDRSQIIGSPLARLFTRHEIRNHVISGDGRWVFYGAINNTNPSSQTLYVAPNAIYEN